MVGSTSLYKWWYLAALFELQHKIMLLLLGYIITRFGSLAVLLRRALHSHITLLALSLLSDPRLSLGLVLGRMMHWDVWTLKLRRLLRKNVLIETLVIFAIRHLDVLLFLDLGPTVHLLRADREALSQYRYWIFAEDKRMSFGLEGWGFLSDLSVLFLNRPLPLERLVLLALLYLTGNPEKFFSRTIQICD